MKLSKKEVHSDPAFSENMIFAEKQRPSRKKFREIMFRNHDGSKIVK